MRTTVEIPEPVGKAAKDLARREQTTLRALIVEGLRLVLKRRRGDSGYEFEDASYGEGGLVPGLTAGDWDAIREQIYQGRGA